MYLPPEVLAKQSRAENPTRWTVFSSKLVVASGDVRWPGKRKDLLSVSVAVGRA